MIGDSQSTLAAGMQSDARGAFAVSLMSRALGALFLAGGTLALLTVLLPHPAQADQVGLLVIVANAYFVSAGLLGLARRVPAWLLPVALAWGSTLITGVAHFSAGRPSPLSATSSRTGTRAPAP